MKWINSNNVLIVLIGVFPRQKYAFILTENTQSRVRRNFSVMAVQMVIFLNIVSNIIKECHIMRNESKKLKKVIPQENTGDTTM